MNYFPKDSFWKMLLDFAWKSISLLSKKVGKRHSLQRYHFHKYYFTKLCDFWKCFTSGQFHDILLTSHGVGGTIAFAFFFPVQSPSCLLTLA